MSVYKYIIKDGGFHTMYVPVAETSLVDTVTLMSTAETLSTLTHICTVFPSVTLLVEVVMVTTGTKKESNT